MEYASTASGILIPKNYEIYVKPTELEISQRKIQSYRKLSEIKQWGLMNPTKFMARMIGVELLDAQEYIFMNSWTKPFVLWLESRAAGKMLDLNTRIPTPYGDVTMGDLKLGDTVFDDSGKPTKVTYLSPINYEPESYDIEFSDGEKIKACADHNWYVYDFSEQKYVVKTTKQMLKNYEQYYGDEKTYNYRVGLCKPLRYKKDLGIKISPYILGLWLGTANHNDSLSVHRDVYNELRSYINDSGYLIYNIDNVVQEQIDIYLISKDYKYLTNQLVEEGLTHDRRYIPKKYLYTSVDDRVELLKGLMDASATSDGDGRCRLFLKNSYDGTLVEDVSFLLSSLGYQYKTYKYNGVFTVVEFYTDSTRPCYKLVDKIMKLPNKIDKKHYYKYITKIKKCDPVPMRCIEVDSLTHLYLCGQNNTITHNTTLLALFSMVKGLLLNNYRTYICSGTADQSQETFRKIEDIALKNIESMTGLTDVFRNEVEVSQANSNGFIHNPMGFTYRLYNGSFVRTLNSSTNSQRGFKNSFFPIF